MGLNFVGHNLSNQFLIATMLREASNENPGALQTLISHFFEDAAKLFMEGICIQESLERPGQKMWFVQLATKGDLRALSKLGSFQRSFSNSVRAPQSRKACGGICHQRLAGQEADVHRGMEAFPFEDLSRTPTWQQSIDRVVPCNEQPNILQGVLVNPGHESQLLAFDLWHTFHLGIAKHWLCSSLAVIVEKQLPFFEGYRSVEAKFGAITEKYKAFCRANRLSMWVAEISRDTLMWPQSSATPIGKWNKGSASTTIMLFLGDFCERYIKGHTDDEMLLLIVPRLPKFYFRGLIFLGVCLQSIVRTCFVCLLLSYNSYPRPTKAT